jgi:hypothetical protein
VIQIFYNIETSYWYDSTSSIDGDYNLIYNAQNPGVIGFHDKLGLDPLFVNPAGDDYHLKAASPAIDAGMPTPLVLVDLDQGRRPQQKGWDMGAYEYQPPLILSAVPGNGSITLIWQVHTDLPPGSTWQIEHTPPIGIPPSPVTSLSTDTRTYSLDGLANGTVYQVTLSAINNGGVLYFITTQATPNAVVILLPVVYTGF